ncbi:MAG: hypothetical protein ACXADW_19935 [Candidatus Hodarchaeales archaeon]|jgi:hypothetical protein
MKISLPGIKIELTKEESSRIILVFILLGAAYYFVRLGSEIGIFFGIIFGVFAIGLVVSSPHPHKDTSFEERIHIASSLEAQCHHSSLYKSFYKEILISMYEQLYFGALKEKKLNLLNPLKKRLKR